MIFHALDMFVLFWFSVKMSRAGIHIYMYIAAMKYLFGVFPSADVMSSYDLSGTPGNDAMS